MKNKMILMVPFSGLGLYGGFRGDRWLRNRIKIFEQFVIPSIKNQSDQDFLVWVCWRPEERSNKVVQALERRMAASGLSYRFSYEGVPMYDDKYEHDAAVDRLAGTLNRVLGDLINLTDDCEEIYVLIQPSDDCYHKEAVASIKAAFRDKQVQAAVFTEGFLCNYTTKELLEYNPKTTPPFAAVKFSRKVFFDPAAHLQHISLKKDCGKYKAGTPLPSHEYLSDCLPTAILSGRGFLVGTHGENISTHFNHPYGGAKIEGEARDAVFEAFGLKDVPPAKIPLSFRKWLMRKLPYPVQRKLRFWFGEIIGNKLYNWLRA